MTTATPSTTEQPAKLGELHFHRLLVAVDGSATADVALGAAVTAARRDTAAITLLAVVPDVLAESHSWIVGAPDPWAMQQEADADARRFLRETVARIPDDIPGTTMMRRGKAGSEIVAQSRQEDYDAILLGARGVGRVGALIGSVSSYVLHHADTTVIVVHAPRERA